MRSSRHDLSATSATGGPRADTDNQICKFCHTPHKANSTWSLWNRRLPTWTYNWGTDLDGNAFTRTTNGTLLPTSLKAASKRCLSCHDGSIAFGDLFNAGGGQAGMVVVDPTSMAGLQYQFGANGNMGTNHPISVPYAGQSGYNGLTSGVPASQVDNGIGGWWRITSAGCDGIYGACTEATGAPLDGTRINLVPESPGATVYGVECVTCHEPHNKYQATSNFKFLRLRVSNQSAICRSCHNK